MKSEKQRGKKKRSEGLVSGRHLLFFLLRADWTQCKVDRGAQRYDSNSRRSGKRRGMKWRKKGRR